MKKPKMFQVKVDIDVIAESGAKAEIYVDVILREAYEKARAISNKHREAINESHRVREIVEMYEI